MFLTFESTDHDSALWLAGSPTRFASSFVRWDETGRVAWTATRGTIVDFLIEFAPSGSHRVALVQVQCMERQCGARRQERGLPANSTLTMGSDGSSVLLDDQAFVVYPTITDLIRDTGTRTLRFPAPSHNDLVSQSREATLVLTDPEQWTGELLQGQTDSHFHLKVETQASPIAR